MKTHNDIVQRAAFRIGLKRADQDLGGSVYGELLSALEDHLLEWNEDFGLDFDPTVNDGVPDERMGALVSLFMYQPAFDQFDARRSASDRYSLERDAKNLLKKQVFGETDFLDTEPADY